tara:strand:- start:1263 stop:2027 length:765 start_codon:yes stop_codon:yes gene_type:complete
MNGIEKELHSYLGKAEKMSGFDSYDDLEGDMSYFDDDYDSFDGDEMSYFDANDSAMSYASGQKAMAISDPYVIQYENTTAGDLTAVLFGYNDFFGAANFGNPAGIVITNLQGGTYGRMIAQSNNKFFKVGKWRFQSATPAQLQQTMNLTHFDANGKNYTTPLNLSIMRDAYQFQADIIDVTKPVTVDGNTQITWNLVAGAVFVISIFPVKMISGKAELNGGTLLNVAKAPRLSGKNVAPVIIQTTQGVRGVSKS